MLFNDIERKVLTVWGCDRRDLTIKRLAYAAAFAVNPNVKRAICMTRDALIEKWEDGSYMLVYLNVIKSMQAIQTGTTGTSARRNCEIFLDERRRKCDN